MWVDFKQTKHARIKVQKNIEINKTIFKLNQAFLI